MNQQRHSPDIPRQSPRALLLDFDGVVLDSAEIKTQAFAKVYSGEPPEKIERIMAYQRQHGGVSRREKFRYFEAEVFGRPVDADRIEALSARFSAISFQDVLSAPFMPGASEMIDALAPEIDLYVVSGTPEDELGETIARRGIARHFRRIYGAPTTKTDAFLRILNSGGYQPAEVLAVGDSTTEYDAATALGIPFIGVLHDRDPSPFPDNVPVVRDLRDMPQLWGEPPMLEIDA